MSRDNKLITQENLEHTTKKHAMTNNEELGSASTTSAATTQVKVSYYVEKNRIITIAYQIYRDKMKKNIKYAASIFKKETNKDTFVKKRHFHTATERLKVRPLWTTFVNDNTEDYFHRLKDHLRSSVHRHGVGSKQRLSEPEVERKIYSKPEQNGKPPEAQTTQIPQLQKKHSSIPKEFLRNSPSR